MADYAIRVENLSKQYRIGAREDQHDTLGGMVASWVRSPWRNWRRLQRMHAPVTADDDSAIWALKDVSFEVKYGEVVGIIGRNGAGKSTLLKIISKITKPTHGRVVLNGRVASLMEVGTGFHPELTGRENVYLNGTLLGMTKGEIDRRFDEIVDFAAIEKFIDTPVKRYSSGMQVRLAFAVAAHLDPEILLIDEVLAVGDFAFQKKCLSKIGDVVSVGRTVVFVSHNMQTVRHLCRRVILMDEGAVAFNGETQQGVQRYYTKNMTFDSRINLLDGLQTRPHSGAYLKSVQFQDDARRPCERLIRCAKMSVVMELVTTCFLQAADVSMAIVHADGTPVFSESLQESLGLANLSPGAYEVEFEFSTEYLKAESYFLTVYFLEHGSVLDHVDRIPLPEIHDPAADELLEARRWGVARVPVRWSQIRKGEHETVTITNRELHSMQA
jgi:lipopolysaccharide transport system ATP-binding protein